MAEYYKYKSSKAEDSLVDWGAVGKDVTDALQAVPKLKIADASGRASDVKKGEGYVEDIKKDILGKGSTQDQFDFYQNTVDVFNNKFKGLIEGRTDKSLNRAEFTTQANNLNNQWDMFVQGMPAFQSAADAQLKAEQEGTSSFLATFNNNDVANFGKLAGITPTLNSQNKLEFNQTPTTTGANSSTISLNNLISVASYNGEKLDVAALQKDITNNLKSTYADVNGRVITRTITNNPDFEKSLDSLINAALTSSDGSSVSEYLVTTGTQDYSPDSYTFDTPVSGQIKVTRDNITGLPVVEGGQDVTSPLYQEAYNHLKEHILGELGYSKTLGGSSGTGGSKATKGQKEFFNDANKLYTGDEGVKEAAIDKLNLRSTTNKIDDVTIKDDGSGEVIYTGPGGSVATPFKTQRELDSILNTLLVKDKYSLPNRSNQAVGGAGSSTVKQLGTFSKPLPISVNTSYDAVNDVVTTKDQSPSEFFDDLNKGKTHLEITQSGGMNVGSKSTPIDLPYAISESEEVIKGMLAQATKKNESPFGKPYRDAAEITATTGAVNMNFGDEYGSYNLDIEKAFEDGKMQDINTILEILQKISFKAGKLTEADVIDKLNNNPYVTYTKGANQI